MSDIFISYSSEDQDWVLPLAAALSGQGWNVWWDRSILGGQPFDEVIEAELAAARAVVVVWSRNSIDSRWVRAEAKEGLDHKKLIPVFLEEIKPPLIFRSIHAINLASWDGNKTSAEFRKLVADIVLLINPASSNGGGGARDSTELPAGHSANPNGLQLQETVSTVIAPESASTEQPPSLSGSHSWIGPAKWIVAAAGILFVIGMVVISFKTWLTPQGNSTAVAPDSSLPVDHGERKSRQVDSCDHPNPHITCLFR
jgi:hypothetical protein